MMVKKLSVLGFPRGASESVPGRYSQVLERCRALKKQEFPSSHSLEGGEARYILSDA
jgi:hypothetical protein